LFRVQGPGFRVQGSEFRVQGLGFKVQDSGFRVQGSGSRVQGSRFRFGGWYSVWDLGCGGQGLRVGVIVYLLHIIRALLLPTALTPLLRTTPGLTPLRCTFFRAMGGTSGTVNHTLLEVLKGLGV
jgi:hypothetical protein